MIFHLQVEGPVIESNIENWLTQLAPNPEHMHLYIHIHLFSHLERPKDRVAYDVATGILELLVTAQLDDPVQQIAGEPSAPQADEERDHQLATVVGLERIQIVEQSNGIMAYINF